MVYRVLALVYLLFKLGNELTCRDAECRIVYMPHPVAGCKQTLPNVDLRTLAFAADVPFTIELHVDYEVARHQAPACRPLTAAVPRWLELPLK